jgi:hypothetical protein
MITADGTKTIRDICLLAGGLGLGLALGYTFRVNTFGQHKTRDISTEGSGGPPVKETQAQAKPKTMTVPKTDLSAFVRAVFEHHGIPSAQAKEATDILVMADLRGIDSHGTARLFAYCKMLRSGLVNPKPVMRVVTEADSTATVDGDNGLGLVVGPWANRLAIAKAKKTGAGFVSVRNTNHYGIAGYYSLQVLAD